MLDHPWVRLVLGALAAALLGAMAARVAVSAGDAGGPPGSASSGPGGRSGSGGGAGGGSTQTGGGASGSASSAGGITASLGAGSGRVTVHVTGEVRRPGVYALREGSRVDDAVRRAGGATGTGDRQALNLAAAVRDGQQVRVPPLAPPRGAAGAAAGASGPGQGRAGPVDLNAATLEELQTLDGVGEATAQKIVELREQRGGIAGVDDLDEIPGIGAKKLEALRAQLEP